MPCSSSDAAATYTISDLALEYDAIIDAAYTEKVSVAQQETVYTPTQGRQDCLTRYLEKRTALG